MKSVKKRNKKTFYFYRLSITIEHAKAIEDIKKE